MLRAAPWRPARSPARGDDIGDQALVAGRSSRAITDGLRDAGVLAERGLDLAELDAEAADLDLVVDAAEELERAVGPPAREVAGAVQPLPGAPNGSATKRSAVRPGRSQIAARQAAAADVELARRRRPAPAAAGRRARRPACCQIGWPIDANWPSPVVLRIGHDVTWIVVSVGP